MEWKYTYRGFQVITAPPDLAAGTRFRPDIPNTTLYCYMIANYIDHDL